MSTEIERYQPHATTGQESTNVDSWTEILGPVADLASKIANTDFVPESLRGKTAAVAAAILAGREMGVPPMTALSSIHVIKGKPGQSAQLMRQLVLAAGHQIRYVETTDTRCVVEGRRRGEEDWQRAVYTADQAKKAQINLGGYPEDKLVARATSRLCRRAFADVLGGMPYSVEELEDEDYGESPESSPEPQAPAKRTARRKATTRTTTKAQTKSEPESQPDPTPEPGFDDEPQPDGHDETITKAQLTKLGAIFTEHSLGDRATRLRISSSLTGRALSSSNDLTKAEATTLIDTLENLASTGDLAGVVEEMLEQEALDDAQEAEQGTLGEDDQ